jgi:hypothetical protein
MIKTARNFQSKPTLLLSLALAIVVLFSLAIAPAFAGPEHAAELFDADPANHGVITKVLERPMGVSLPDTGFNFSATPHAYNGSTAGVQNVPAIASISVSTEDGIAPDIWNRTDNPSVEVVNHDMLGIHAIERDLRFNFAGVFDRPGEYDYIIEMQDNAYPDVTDASERYLMRVTVEDDDGVNKVAAVNFFNFAGNTQGAESEARFTSTFTPGGGTFTVGKLVDGDGDTNALFDFRVRLTNTAFVDDNAFVEATIINYYDATISTHNIVYNVWYSFQLQHEWTLNFEDLPLGTAFMVEEMAATNYYPAVEVVIDGSTPFTHVSTERNRELSSETALGQAFPVENRVVGPDENSVTFTNYYPTVTDTHLVMDNLIWIAAAAVAALAFVVLILIIRRRAA